MKSGPGWAERQHQQAPMEAASLLAGLKNKEPLNKSVVQTWCSQRKCEHINLLEYQQHQQPQQQQQQKNS
jgi:hypothetical protein